MDVIQKDFIAFVLTMLLFVVNAIEMEKLLANDGSVNDKFGNAVSIHGERALIGSYYHDGNTGNVNNAGLAYIFNVNVTDGTWRQTAKLFANDGAVLDYFGFSVALYENNAIIGAYSGDGVVYDSGAAYIFSYNESSSSWNQTAKLFANDGENGDQFGYSVAIQDGIAVIGAYLDDTIIGPNSGSAYIFTYNNMTKTWNETMKLIPSNGSVWDHFGVSVSLDHNNIIIGADRDDTKATDSGSAYIWTLINGQWTNTTKLLATDGKTTDNFGHSVSISGNYALVGAWYVDDIGNDEGAVYIFHYNDTWKQIQKINANDTSDEYGSRFGNTLSINGMNAIIGAYRDNDMGYESGSAYIFSLNETNGLWVKKVKIVTNDSVKGDQFGFSVALNGYNAIIGARNDDDNGIESGSAYIVTNYNDCNQIKTQIANEQYLINWKWTVCFTTSPTTHPTINPTLEPTVNPTVNPTTSTNAPTIYLTSILCAEGYGIGINFKIELKLNYTANNTQIKKALNAAISEEINDENIELQSDYEVIVSAQYEGVILLNANVSVCNPKHQTILIAEFENNLESTFINKINDTKLIAILNDIHLDLVRINKTLIVSKMTTTEGLITSDSNSNRIAIGNDNTFWNIIWILITFILCICIILGGIMIYKCRKDRKLKEEMSTSYRSNVIMTNTNNVVSTSKPMMDTIVNTEGVITDENDLLIEGDDVVVNTVNELTDNGFVVNANTKGNDDNNDNDIVSTINGTDAGQNNAVDMDVDLIDSVNKTKIESGGQQINGEYDNDNGIVATINGTDAGQNNDVDNDNDNDNDIVATINGTDAGQNNDDDFDTQNFVE